MDTQQEQPQLVTMRPAAVTKIKELLKEEDNPELYGWTGKENGRNVWGQTAVIDEWIEISGEKPVESDYGWKKTSSRINLT